MKLTRIPTRQPLRSRVVSAARRAVPVLMYLAVSSSCVVAGYLIARAGV